jgi:tetratricopeptide (TPR) repeat protein
LQAIVELSADTLQRGLAHLQAAEFVYETRLFPEHAYTFKHALTHEVAYGSLLQERRRALHTRIVDVLEVLYADRLADHAERLAHHAFRGEVWRKALTYLRQASVKAIARSAHREAVVCLEQALEALGHLPKDADTIEQAIGLWFDLQNPLFMLGELHRMFSYLREADNFAQTMGDQSQRADVSRRMAYYLWLIGEHERAIDAGQRALAQAQALQDILLQVRATTTLADAITHAGCALELACGAKERANEAYARQLLGTIHAHVDSPDAEPAEAHYRQALALAEVLGMRPLQAHCHLGLGTLHARTGQRQQARAELSAAIALYRAMDMTFWLPQAKAALAQVSE